MEQDTPRNFKFINFGIELDIQINENNQVQCPKCNQTFKQLLQHIKKSTECRTSLDFENFHMKYKSFTNRRKQNLHRQIQLQTQPERVQSWRKKIREN